MCNELPRFIIPYAIFSLVLQCAQTALFYCFLTAFNIYSGPSCWMIFNTSDYIPGRCFCLLSEAYQTNAQRQVRCIELKVPLNNIRPFAFSEVAYQRCFLSLGRKLSLVSLCVFPQAKQTAMEWNRDIMMMQSGCKGTCCMFQLRNDTTWMFQHQPSRWQSQST